MQDGIVAPEKEEAEPEKVYLGGMGQALESYSLIEEELKFGDEGYVLKDGDEGYVNPDELKFGDEGYILKKGDEGYVAPAVDYLTFEKEALVTEVNKFESLANEREQTILELQKNGGEAETANAEEIALLKSLSEDFVGNYSKAKEKYGLPSIDTLHTLMSEGNVDDKVKHWQDNELVKVIETKHNMEEGEFEYDSNEASKANTPSYNWDRMTSDKRNELVGSLRETQSAESERLRKVEGQQKEDITWLADTYFDKSEDVARDKVKAMDDIVSSIAQGQTTPDKHPFAFRNLVRGVFFDDLSKSMVDKAVEDIVAQFAEKQMYLPGKELPTNVTDVKPAPSKPVEIDEKVRKNSPMMSSIYNATK